jgi:hypothetical protein
MCSMRINSYSALETASTRTERMLCARSLRWAVQGGGGPAGPWRVRDTASAKRLGPEAPPEIWVASGQMFLVLLERIAGRTKSTYSSLRLGIVAYVAFATVIGTWPHVQLRQAVGISQRRLIDVASS